MENSKRLNSIRSFIRREGRLTPAQRRAIDTLWESFGVTPSGLIDLDSLFNRQAPRILEIGFGNGESLAAIAKTYSEMDFLGVEVHRPGVGRLLIQAEGQALTNLKVICMDAVELLERHLPDTCLDRIQIFFPDPWPKQRHHKRRLIQPHFASLMAGKLKPEGCLHLATDWEDYALHMRAVLEAASDFSNTAGPGKFAPRPEYRPLTKFERRGQRLGHGVWDLIYRKKLHNPC